MQLKIVKIECEAPAGSEVQRIVMEAVKLADHHKCIVKLKFNDVPFELTAYSIVSRVLDEYFERLSPKPIK